MDGNTRTCVSIFKLINGKHFERTKGQGASANARHMVHKNNVVKCRDVLAPLLVSTTLARRSEFSSLPLCVNVYVRGTTGMLQSLE